MRSTLFWGVTQYRLVICYRRFGIAYQYCLQGSSSPGPSVTNYQRALRNIPEECISYEGWFQVIISVIVFSWKKNQILPQSTQKVSQLRSTTRISLTVITDPSLLGNCNFTSFSALPILSRKAENLYHSRGNLPALPLYLFAFPWSYFMLHFM
jgi:hypothetical protein